MLANSSVCSLFHCKGLIGGSQFLFANANTVFWSICLSWCCCSEQIYYTEVHQEVKVCCCGDACKVPAPGGSQCICRMFFCVYADRSRYSAVSSNIQSAVRAFHAVIWTNWAVWILFVAQSFISVPGAYSLRPGLFARLEFKTFLKLIDHIWSSRA